jgi:hypothetical protein
MNRTNYTNFAKEKFHETSVAIDYNQPTPKRNDFLQSIDGGGASNSLLGGLRLGILRDTRLRKGQQATVLQVPVAPEEAPLPSATVEKALYSHEMRPTNA